MIKMRLNINRSILLGLSVFIIGCAPSIKRSGYNDISVENNVECDVSIEKSSAAAEPKGYSIGLIKVRDTGFSINCGYDDVITILKNEACKQQANYVYIRKEKYPSFFGSSCYRVEAELYKVTPENITKIQTAQNEKEESKKVDKNGRNTVLLILGYTVGLIGGFVLVTLLRS